GGIVLRLPNLETAARPQERDKLLHQLNGNWNIIALPRLTVAIAVTAVTFDPVALGIARNYGAQMRDPGGLLLVLVPNHRLELPKLQHGVPLCHLSTEWHRMTCASASAYDAGLFRHRRLLGLIDTGIGFGSARVHFGLQAVGKPDALARI